MNNPARYWMMIGVLLAATAGMGFLSHGEATPPARPFNEFPKDIGQTLRIGEPHSVRGKKLRYRHDLANSVFRKLKPKPGVEANAGRIGSECRLPKCLARELGQLRRERQTALYGRSGQTSRNEPTLGAAQAAPNRSLNRTARRRRLRAVRSAPVSLVR